MFLYGGSKTSREFTPLYSWWACVLMLKLLSFTWFTGRARVRCKTIHSEEDRMWLEDPETKICPDAGGHLEVDQLRYGHVRNLAVITPFLLITPMWLNTDPSRFLVNIILRLFPISRILDTLFYMKLLEAPRWCRIFVLMINYVTVVFISLANILL